MRLATERKAVRDEDGAIAQLGVQSPDVGTLRSISDGNLKTLSDHQIFAQTIVNFRSIAEHQRRYVIRWLKEQLTGRPERSQLISDLKRWCYEHRIVIPPDRTLRQFIVQAVHLPRPVRSR
ncbi:DUF4158 domain-containing protein [Paraburkholderia youngii]|uniref:DUF4158 domain-containing protein n=1 Tax=Paraburkholderia youngii TaxID=2782701 RepID=UPI0035A12DF3